MVSGRRVYHHPSRLDRGYILDKLLTFHREHGTPPYEILRDLRQAASEILRASKWRRPCHCNGFIVAPVSAAVRARGDWRHSWWYWPDWALMNYNTKWRLRALTQACPKRAPDDAINPMGSAMSAM